MAVVVESGTGSNPAANCYASVAFCDSYHKDRGNDAWTNSTATAKKEAAIINGADYLSYNYEWKGDQRYDFQPLRWPRSFGYVDVAFPLIGLEDIVPIEVAKANAELALLALTGALNPPTQGPAILSESKGIAGAITKSTTYAANGGYSSQRRFPHIDRMLARLATGGSSGVRFVRIDRG